VTAQPKHKQPKRGGPAKRSAKPAPKPKLTVTVVTPAAPQLPAAAPTWTTRRVKLSSLTPWPRNPRKINDAQSARLLNSFDEFGQVELIALGPNNEVYNGHQRLKVLAAKHGPDFELEARVCSRELSELEREKLTIYLHKGAAGEFDLEVLLKEFDPIKLDEWGMPDLNIPDVAEDEWKEMPEFDGTPRSFARVTVMFTCAEDVGRFAALVGQDVTVETVSIWYPAKDRADLSTQQWGETKGSDSAATEEPAA
jgi:hypothetical protein